MGRFNLRPFGYKSHNSDDHLAAPISLTGLIPVGSTRTTLDQTRVDEFDRKGIVTWHLQRHRGGGPVEQNGR
jgi:hypothetical protein